jgi:outer membrane protein W
MKLTRSWLPGALLLALAAEAGAQPPGPVSRADLTGSIAWLNVNKAELDAYDNWVNRAVYGGAGFGWYWTDNLKTEIDGGVSSKVDRDVYSVAVVDGRQTITESAFHFRTARIAVGQNYQFFRNVWFHPHVGAGVDLTWETIDREDESALIFNPASPQSPVNREAQAHPRTTELLTRPFAAVGFKTYLSQQSFFRTDLKLVFKGGVDEVLLRFGVGVDF